MKTLYILDENRFEESSLSRFIREQAIANGISVNYFHVHDAIRQSAILPPTGETDFNYLVIPKMDEIVEGDGDDNVYEISSRLTRILDMLKSHIGETFCVSYLSESVNSIEDISISAVESYRTSDSSSCLILDRNTERPLSLFLKPKATETKMENKSNNLYKLLFDDPQSFALKKIGDYTRHLGYEITLVGHSRICGSPIVSIDNCSSKNHYSEKEAIMRLLDPSKDSFSKIFATGGEFVTQSNKNAEVIRVQSDTKNQYYHLIG